MSRLYKYKIENLLSLKHPFDFIYDENIFKTSKKSCEKVDSNILLRKNLYPFSFDFKNKKITFVETKEIIPHNNVSFFYTPLQKEAEYIIHVPFTELKKISSDSEIKDRNILFIHHPGRTGSTLLHRVLGSNPGVESFSEDMILENLIWWMHTENVSFDQIRSIYTSILNLMMKKWCDAENKIISLKDCTYSQHYMSYLFRMFPEAYHIYLTRDPVEIAISVENIIHTWSTPYQRLKRKIFRDAFKKNYFADFLELDVLTGVFIENGDYAKYIHEHITFKMKSSIGLLDNFERIILRIVLIDRFFESLKNNKILFLRYTDVLNKKLLFKTLKEFLPIDKKSYFNKEVYSKHSQADTKFKGFNKKYFKLTKRLKKKYTLFADRVKQIIDAEIQKTGSCLL